MSVDPLDRLRRPVASDRSRQVSTEHSVAPEWIGQCLRRSGDAVVPSLILRSRDGRLTALSYSYLTAVRFMPPSMVELDFVGYAVSIEGKRLKIAFDDLAGQVVMELVESSAEFDEGGEGPFIEAIAIVATQER
ncbi:MAG: hypothetical protein JKY43_02450 [Phycisphaerales bacterium]|nr:hypothetical protein [Phycisphaerales bacterium]